MEWWDADCFNNRYLKLSYFHDSDGREPSPGPRTPYFMGSFEHIFFYNDRTWSFFCPKWPQWRDLSSEPSNNVVRHVVHVVTIEKLIFGNPTWEWHLATHFWSKGSNFKKILRKRYMRQKPLLWLFSSFVMFCFENMFVGYAILLVKFKKKNFIKNMNTFVKINHKKYLRKLSRNTTEQMCISS